jgi:hypothetical protein
VIGFVARALGVDPEAHRLLHRTFSDLARRGGSALVARKQDTRAASMTAVYVTYGAFGLMTSAGALFGLRGDAFATQVCSTALVLLAIAVVADFASVVIAPGDDEILFHLPISSRTYLAARATVAAAHTTRMALAFGAAPTVVAALVTHDALYAGALLVALVLTGGFALILSFVLYRVALRLLGGERLRTTLAYLPGFISLLATLGPQFLMPRTPAPRGGAVTTEVLGAWTLYAPPAWFAALPTLAGGTASALLVARAALGVVALPVGAFLLLRALGGSFLAELIALVGAKDGGPVSARTATRPLPPGRATRFLLGLRSPEAQAGYLLAVGASRSREVRARTFAFLLMPLAFAVLGLVRRTGSGFTGPLTGLFFAGASAGTLVAFLPYHEHRDAGWIHEALPFRRYGAYYLGVVAAVLWRQLGPWLALILALAIVHDPTPTGIGFAFHAATGSLLGVPLYLSSEDDPPYSRAFVSGEQSGRVGLYLLNLLAVALLAASGWALARFAPVGLAISSPVFLATFVLWTRAIGRRLDAYPPAFLYAARPVRA